MNFEAEDHGHVNAVYQKPVGMPSNNKEEGKEDESKQAVLPWQQTLEKFTQRMGSIESKLEAMAMQNSINSQSHSYNLRYQRNSGRGQGRGGR